MTKTKQAKNKEKATSADKSIILFDDMPVRRVWVENEEKWYFAIVDV